MTEVLDEAIAQAPLLVHTSPVIEMDDEQFFQFCQINRDLRIERTAQGDLIIMAPAGSEGSSGNARLTRLFDEWAEREGSGIVHDSSGGFVLPDGSIRSPDVSWIRKDRIAKLSRDERQRFLRLCPDFVLELRSQSDSVQSLQEKMEEYIENGARLGWLIDPIKKQVHIYRPNRAPEIMNNPERVSGEDVLNGFSLELQRVWSAMDR